MGSDGSFGGYGSDKLPQIDSSHEPGKGYDPLSELMRAIILRVIDDYNSSGEEHTAAVEYLFDEEEDYIFSFVAITRHLGLNPEMTRERIMNPVGKISTRRRAA